MTSYRHGQGYLINGVNATRPCEADILTCAHCQKILYLHTVPGQVNWREDGGWCHREQKPLCADCGTRALTRGCEPFLKTLEGFEREQRRLATMIEDAQLIVLDKS